MLVYRSSTARCIDQDEPTVVSTNWTHPVFFEEIFLQGNDRGLTVTENSQTDTDDARQPRTRRQKIWITLAIIFVAILAIPGMIFAVAYVRADTPEPSEVTTAQVSHIYASDGTTELARLVPPEGNRTFVSLEDLPEYVSNAVLAAEDRDFWDNSGFSVSGFLRAAWGQVTGNANAGGGSTITQQYVKNVIVGDDHSYARKWNELVHSIKMTNEWDKAQILESYLNTVYFGRNAYGIEAASTAYFNKPATELTIEEAAVLAATIQVPNQLDPWNNRERAEGRWNYVLDGLVEMGLLPAEQRAGMFYPETRDPAEYSAYTEATGPNGHIKNKVIEELESLGITEDDVTNRGLQVTTTIDQHVQNSVLQSVEENMAGLQEDARSAVVTIEPATGAVRGYYGGDEASGWDYASAGLQTGSTFKIVGLAAALQQGIPLGANYASTPVMLPGGIEVTNSDGNGCGVCSIATALEYSYNTSFIRLQDDLVNGTQDTADMGHALGVAKSFPGVAESLTENGEQPYEGIVLGQYQSRVLDMATVMATLTNHGVYNQPHFVSRVETSRGEVLYEHNDHKPERRVSETVADNVIQAMQPVAAHAGQVLAGGRPSASKTGTAQLGDTGLNKDAWMVGGTPELSTAVWVGTADNTSAIFNQYGGNMYGANTPGSIWKDSLDRALEGREQASFESAAPVRWRTYGNSGSNLIESYVPPTSSGTGRSGYGSGTGGVTTPNQAPETPADDAEDDQQPGQGEQAPAPGGQAPGGQGQNGGQGGATGQGGQGGQNQGGQGGRQAPPAPGAVIEDAINELENLL